jgi:hypothetical protein
MSPPANDRLCRNDVRQREITLLEILFGGVAQFRDLPIFVGQHGRFRGSLRLQVEPQMAEPMMYRLQGIHDGIAMKVRVEWFSLFRLLA